MVAFVPIVVDGIPVGAVAAAREPWRADDDDADGKLADPAAQPRQAARSGGVDHRVHPVVHAVPPAVDLRVVAAVERAGTIVRSFSVAARQRCRPGWAYRQPESGARPGSAGCVSRDSRDRCASGGRRGHNAGDVVLRARPPSRHGAARPGRRQRDDGASRRVRWSVREDRSARGRRQDHRNDGPGRVRVRGHRGTSRRRSGSRSARGRVGATAVGHRRRSALSAGRCSACRR